MNSEQEPRVERGSLLKLAFLALLAGMASGFMGSAFRLALRRADNFRNLSLTWAHDHRVFGFRPCFPGASSRLSRPMGYPGSGTIVAHIGLGVFVGLLGVGYNRTILGALATADRLRRYAVELRAAVIGGAVGLLAWFAPGLVGGGDAITQQMLLGTNVVFMYGLVFAVRFALGAVSYAAQTPGGLFAPMLALGAQSGLFFGTYCCQFFPGIASHPTEFAVVGMAAFFTAVARAPLTGIILAIELTGSFTLLLHMLGACAVAMLVPTLLNNPPIYDSLRKPSPSV